MLLSSLTILFTCMYSLVIITSVDLRICECVYGGEDRALYGHKQGRLLHFFTILINNF